MSASAAGLFMHDTFKLGNLADLQRSHRGAIKRIRELEGTVKR